MFNVLSSHVTRDRECAVRALTSLCSVMALLVMTGCAADDSGMKNWFSSPSKDTAEASEKPSEAVVNELPKDKGALANHDDKILKALKNRNSVVKSGSTEAKVVDAVMAADTSPAAAEVRAAVLKAEARDKNWLPQIDPKVSLAGLSTLAGALLADMVLFDNGRKKQERAYAHADIDVAAVSLAQVRNDRIKEALGLQISASEAREKSAISGTALKQMTEYRRILQGRVGGGVDNPADLVEMDRMIAELRAESEGEKRTLESATNQLSGMTNGAISEPPRPTGLANVSGEPVALPVLRAEAEHKRELAELKMARAMMMPTLAAGTTTGMGGTSGAVSTGGSVMIFGRKAEIGSLEARTNASADKMKTIGSDTSRELQRYIDDAASYRSGAKEGRAVAAELEKTHDLYYKQFRGGQRKLIDVANIYMSMTNQQKSAIGQAYQALDSDLSRSGQLGVLLDGDKI